MKKYQLLIDIEEGSDEFWEELEREGTTGCDMVTKEISDILFSSGFQDAKIKLVSYTDK